MLAKKYTDSMLKDSDNGNFDVISHGEGKYGRVLGEIFVKGNEKSLNDLLKEHGHAYEYHGGKKKKFSEDKEIEDVTPTLGKDIMKIIK